MNRSVLLLIVFLFIGTSLQSATLSNKYLLIDVDDETGRIFISTVEGRDEIKGDERKDLLFFDRTPSSYTVIYVNGDAVIFGRDRGSFTKRPVSIGETIESVWESDPVRAYQNVQLIKRKKTDCVDGVLITYTLENKGKYNISAGLRILFDTYLGESGIYHFELSDGRRIQYETMLEKNNLPESWLSKMDTPESACLRGVLKGELVTIPDSVIFANYRALREGLFNYRVRKGKNFDFLPYSKNDSAVAIYYNPTELAPGKSIEYSTIIGLCGDGEYGEEEVEAYEVREEVLKEEPVKEEKEHPVREINLELIKNELAGIDRTRNSLDRINELITELNQILEKESKFLDEEEIIRLKSMLNDLLKKREESE